ncbi:MAG: hypothetical protein QME66_08250 [Candidatus Eisenbacteria bacterium]|nr:hypothetical protein [Candidatus Eisenbacteria bacterium]
MGWLDKNIPGYKQVSAAASAAGDWTKGLLFGGKQGGQSLQFSSPEQEAAYEAQMKALGGPTGMIAQATGAGQVNKWAAMDTVQNFNPAVQGPTSLGPQAQTQFSIGGAPTGLQQAQGQTFTAQRPGELTAAMQGLQGFTPDQSVTQAQQNLAGVMGGLGAFTQGAGSGQSAATLAQSAALGKMQETSMANALGQLREQGFTGAATAGGMGNLAAMAAAQSAGQFAQQRAQLLESERQAALQAAGMQGQFAQGMGQLGLGMGQQRLGGLTSLGGLGSEEANRMLQAQTETGRQGLMATQMNQDAALRSAQLAQQGDIAGAELALKGTGLNMQQAQALAGMQLDAATTTSKLGLQQAGMLSDLQMQNPQMQALNAQLQYMGLLSPQMAQQGGRSYGVVGDVVGAVGRGAGEEYGRQLVS